MRACVPAANGFHRYVTDEPLEPGGCIRLEGRFWLVETVEPTTRRRACEWHPLAIACACIIPTITRLRCVPPVRRGRAARRPRLHHDSTEEPVTWSVVEERLAHDELSEPYLDLLAERDYSEREEPGEDLHNHELEYSEAAAEALTQAQAAGQAAELVALDPGGVPDWDEAARSIDVLGFEEVEDDLFELCGVDVGEQPQDTWLDTVKERLRNDLASFRDDIEGDHDEIEEWDFLDGKIFAVVGSADDESNPDIGFDWLCRLLDAGVLRAGGFHRVRKPALEASSE